MKDKIFNFFCFVLISFFVLVRLFYSDWFYGCDNVLGYVAIIFVLVFSIYFSFKLKFLQFNIREIGKSFCGCSFDDVKSLFMTLGSKIGVGNIVGITLAVYTCGSGVMLFIWIINLLSSILTYCETYLGCKYKGGSFYYINNGLNNRGLALIYTVVLIFIYVVGFVGIQANSIVTSVTSVINTSKYLVAFILVIIIGIIIFKGISSVIDFVSKIVPVMCILYLVMGGLIIYFSPVSFISCFKIIIKDAIRLDSAVMAIIITGLKRGIFATESGLGTSSIATSISNNNPRNQGLFQVLGVHFISLVVITITGFIVIGNGSGYVGRVDGVDIMITIFNNYFGYFGKICLTVVIILFSVSTIMGGYFYGIKGLEFIKKKLSSGDYLWFRVVLLLFMLLGSIIESSIIWGIVDGLVLILLIINIYCMFKLRKHIK